MKRASMPVAGALMFLAPLGHMTSAVAKPGAAPTGPTIHVEDLYRFYRLYEATGGHPTADQLQHDYLDPGSDGLHNLAINEKTRKRHVFCRRARRHAPAQSPFAVLILWVFAFG
jgi:hypothetical protein